MERSCKQCGGYIIDELPVPYCLTCLRHLEPEVLENLFYTVKDLAALPGYSEEHIRRLARKGGIPGRINFLGRHYFLKAIVDADLGKPRPATPTPATPRQAEAYERCQRGDHEWLGDEEYREAYFEKETSRLAPNRLKIMFVRTCFFCGHQQTYDIGGMISP